MEARTDPQQDLCGIDGAGIFAGCYFGEGWYGPSPFSFLRSSDVLRIRNAAQKVRSISSETLQKVIQAIRLHPDYGKKSPLSAESILAKLREFAPVLSNLR